MGKHMLQIAKEIASSGLFTAENSAFNLAAESTFVDLQDMLKITKEIASSGLFTAADLAFNLAAESTFRFTSQEKIAIIHNQPNANLPRSDPAAVYLTTITNGTTTAARPALGLLTPCTLGKTKFPGKGGQSRRAYQADSSLDGQLGRGVPELRAHG
ncbi:hypothetical protein A6R68_05455, partial [Neotoma lepida]